MKGRIATAVVATVLGVAGLMAAAPGVAGAATPHSSASCNISGSVTLSPGLGFSPKKSTDTLSAKLSTCKGISGITSGSLAGKLHSNNQSCTGGTATGTFSVKWNNGKTSTTTATVKHDGNEALEFLVSGKFTKGVENGKTYSGKVTLTPSKGNCVTTPVTKGTFKGSLDIS